MNGPRFRRPGPARRKNFSTRARPVPPQILLDPTRPGPLSNIFDPGLSKKNFRHYVAKTFFFPKTMGSTRPGPGPPKKFLDPGPARPGPSQKTENPTRVKPGPCKPLILTCSTKLFSPGHLFRCRTAATKRTISLRAQIHRLPTRSSVLAASNMSERNATISASTRQPTWPRGSWYAVLFRLQGWMITWSSGPGCIKHR